MKVATGICGEPDAFVESPTVSAQGLSADWLPWLTVRQVTDTGWPASALVGLEIFAMIRSATGRTVSTATVLVADPAELVTTTR